MSQAPIVSIIIAAYQARSFIADTVRSALRQRVPDIEILISPDEPRDAADYSFLAALDPRVRVLPEVPASTGAGPARNRALGAARGQLIALLDADDLWSPDYLARLIPLAQRHGAAFAPTRITDWQGVPVREIKPQGEMARFGDFETAYGSLHGIALNRPARRWRDVLAEDVLFDLETLALCEGAATVAADVFYQLRLRPASVTQGDRFIADIGAGYDRLIEMIGGGETLIPAPQQEAAKAVFRNWQKMNLAFMKASTADPSLGYQHFVARLPG